MKIKTYPASLVSFSAILIKPMGKNIEVLCTCRGSITMATIYVVMFGKTFYEYSQYGKQMCICSYNMKAVTKRNKA